MSYISNRAQKEREKNGIDSSASTIPISTDKTQNTESLKQASYIQQRAAAEKANRNTSSQPTNSSKTPSSAVDDRVFNSAVRMLQRRAQNLPVYQQPASQVSGAELLNRRDNLQKQLRSYDVTSDGIADRDYAAAELTLENLRNVNAELKARQNASKEAYDQQQMETLSKYERPESYTVENVADYFERAKALSDMNSWTDEQKAEAQQLASVLPFMDSESRDWDTSDTALADRLRENDEWKTVAETLRYKTHPGLTGFVANLASGLGITSGAEAVATSLGKLGVDTSDTLKGIETLKGAASYGMENAPVASMAGSIAGTVALNTALSSVVQGAGAAIDTGIWKATSLAPSTLSGAERAAMTIITRSARNSLVFSGMNAVQGLGSYVTGKNDHYGSDILSGGISGAVSGLVGNLSNMGFTSLMRKYNLTSPFVYYSKEVASGLLSSGAYIGTDYLTSEEKPSAQEIGRRFAVSFLFTLLQSGMDTYRVTRQNQAVFDRIDAELKKSMNEYASSQDMSTPEARTAFRDNMNSRITWMKEQILNASGNPDFDVINKDAGLKQIWDSLSAFEEMVNSAEFINDVPTMLGDGGSAAASSQYDAAFNDAISGAIINMLPAPASYDALPATTGGSDVIYMGGPVASNLEAIPLPGPVASSTSSADLQAAPDARNEAGRVIYPPKENIAQNGAESLTAVQEASPQESPVGLGRIAMILGGEGMERMVGAYDGKLNQFDYAEDFIKVYNAAKEGKAIPQTRLNEMQTFQAKVAGENAAKQEVINNGREVSLRNGSEWLPGQNSGEQVRTVESWTGRAEERNGVRTIQGARDQEFQGIALQPGRSAAEVVPGADASQVVHTFKAGEGTQAMKAAQSFADAIGMKLTQYADGYLNVTTRSGAKAEMVQAMVDEDTGMAYVNVSDPRYDALQLTEHEGTHHLIRNGKIDKEAFYDRFMTDHGDLWGAVKSRYQNIYRGLNMKNLDLFEEFLADSMGGINQFEGLQLEQTIGQAMRELALQITAQVQTLERFTGRVSGETKFSKSEIGMQNKNSQSDDYIKTYENPYDGKNFTEDSEIYSYAFLTALPDMHPVEIPLLKDIPHVNGNIDKSEVSKKGLENALSVGRESDGTVKVRNIYTGRDLQVSRNSIRHGLEGKKGRLFTNSRIGIMIGDIVENAVPINAISNKTDNLAGTYVMAGFVYDSDNKQYVAIVTVEQHANIADIEVYDVVHALNGRKNNSSWSGTKPQSFTSTTTATISIKDFLDIVNNTHRSLLSQDVLDHFNEARPANGYYSNSAKFSMRAESEGERMINESMTMDQAKRMIQAAFNEADIRGWGDYNTAEEWLAGAGVDEVTEYVESSASTQDILARAEAWVDGDITTDEIIQAYVDGTLRGKQKQASTVDTSISTGYQDDRFYAPKFVQDAMASYDVADQRMTDRNRDAVIKARKDIIFYAHNEGAEAALGLTKSELNKKLQSWSRYPAAARELSKKLNQGVAPENQWTGLQNSAILATATITDGDLKSQVKAIKGNSTDYQRNYIGRTMMALDTHIDWSELTFDFVNAAYLTESGSSRAIGTYDNSSRTVQVGALGSLNTVAHEMGHALDYKWTRDLINKAAGSGLPLSETNFSKSDVNSEQEWNFYNHFKDFVDDIASVGDLRSSYTMRGTETFARFVAKFVEWTDETTGNQFFTESRSYDDKFTTKQFTDFVKLLQEKAAIDSRKAMETPKAKFSMKAPVEQAKDLIAVHNTTEDNLEKALKLGAIPSPSIAIIKAEMGHEKFGPISIVYPADSIDPEKDRRNKIYGSDAWTPTAGDARVEYPIDHKVMHRIDQRMADLSGRAAGGAFYRSAILDGILYGDDTTDDAKELARRIAGKDEVKAAYLADQGNFLDDIVYKAREYDSHYPNEVVQQVVDQIGPIRWDLINDTIARTGDIRDALTDADMDRIKAVVRDHEVEMHRPFNDLMKERKGWSDEEAEQRLQQRVDDYLENRVSIWNYYDLASSARKMQQDLGKRNLVVDKAAMKQKLDEATRGKEQEIEAWALDQLDGLLGEPGIYNGKDPFDARGNRKSFKQLHWEYTAENIVKAMNRVQARGRGYAGYGAEGIHAVATTNFDSLDDVRAEKGRLRLETPEEYEAKFAELNEEIDAVADKLLKKRDYNELEALSDAFMTAAQYRAITPIQSAFKRNGFTINDDLANRILQIYKTAAEIPTGYFEAKPQRAMGFDEAAAAIVPDNMDADLKSRLQAAGLNMIEYKAGDEADRLKKLNSIEGVRFSRRATNDSIEQLRQSNDELRNTVAQLNKDLKTATQRADKAQTQLQRTTTPTARAEDVRRLARQYVTGTDADLKETEAKMQALANKIIQGGTEGTLVYDELLEDALEIVRPIVEGTKELMNSQELETINGIRNYFRSGKFHFDNLARYNDARSNIGKAANAGQTRGEITDYETLRRHNFGRFTLTRDTNARAIDDAWMEAQGMFGKEYFPEDITNIPDMIQHISELLDTLGPVYENPYSYEMAEAKSWMASELLNDLIGESVRQAAPTYADRMNQKLERQAYQARERMNEALAKEREKRDEAVQAIKDHYKDMAKAKRERKLESADRTRLLNIAKRLANKKMPAANRALINQYIGELDLTAKSMTGKTLQKLSDLRDWYEDRKANDPDFISDPNIEKAIARLSKHHISELTIGEVRDLIDVLLNIENELRTEKKLIDSQVKEDLGLAAVKTIADVKNSKGSKGGAIDSYVVTELVTPERELRRLSGYAEGSPLAVAGKELSEGQRKMFDYTRRANNLFRKWIDNKAFAKSIAGEKAQTITITGSSMDGPVEVEITPAMRMSLYLHSLNDQNLKHINNGGITVPDMKLYKKGNIQEAYNKGTTVRLTPSQVREITAFMTTEERAFANAAHDYFNGMSRDSINETSEKLKGYSLAGVEDYFPIQTDTSFLAKDFDSIKQDGTIPGMGFTKERVNASNPIMLYDMNDVLTRSIKQHSKYVGLAIPVRNFNKLWNARTGGYDAEGNWNSYGNTVQKEVSKKWGGNATNYVERMMKGLNNSSSLHEKMGDLLSKTRSHYAGAVLSMNAGVAIKQAASYPTAAAVVGWKPLLQALNDPLNKKVNLDIVAKYTPLLWYRSQGFSSQELGDIASRGKQLPKFLNWIQGMDVWTTTKLWSAAEYYVRDNFKNLDRGSDAYYKQVAEVYNRIIEETQPNYTTMQRPQVLRSENELTKTLNMFKTQPFQNFNILYDAFGELEAKRTAYRNTGTAEAKAAFQEAKKGAARAVSSQLISAVVFALMQFAWDALRGRDDKYKDKEGDLTPEAWMKGLGLNVLSNGFGMLPYGGFMLELAETTTDKILKEFDKEPFFDATFYGLEASPLEAINDVADNSIRAIVQTAGMVNKAINEKDVNFETYGRTVWAAIENWAQFLGQPVANIRKTAEAVAYQSLKASMGPYVGKYYSTRITSDPAKYPGDYYDLLYKAYKDDPDAYKEIYDLLISDKGFGGNAAGEIFTTDKIRTNMEQRMKDEQGVTNVKNLNQRYMTPDEQSKFDRYKKQLQGEDLWDRASKELQQKALETVYNLSTDSKAAQKLQEKIDGGKSIGLTDTQYILYQLALDMVDQPTESGKLGTYVKAEKDAALDLIDFDAAIEEYLRYNLYGTDAEKKAHGFN